MKLCSVLSGPEKRRKTKQWPLDSEFIEFEYSLEIRQPVLLGLARLADIRQPVLLRLARLADICQRPFLAIA
jgi:hypothetical protein